jgi:hypothetical protein
MASVPNTTTFSLLDVKNVIGSQFDLTACFTYAVGSYFDPTYSGSKNSLMNFRNYTQPFIYVDHTTGRWHYNTLPYDFTITNVSYGPSWAGLTYTYNWTTGSHFYYSKSGDAFTIGCNGTNTSGTSWSDTLTFRLSGGLTATVSVVQFTSPN